MSDSEEKITGVVIADRAGLVCRSSALAKRGIELLNQLPWKSKSLFKGDSYCSSISSFGQVCVGTEEEVSNEPENYVSKHVIEIANLGGTDSLTLSAPAAFPHIEGGRRWGFAADPTCFAWDPSARYLVTGSANPEAALRLFDVRERRFVECFGRHADGLFHLAWSDSGEYIASSSIVRDPHLKIWRCTWSDDLFGRAIRRIELVAETTSISGVAKHFFDETTNEYRGLYGFYALAFDHDSKLLAVVSQIRDAHDDIAVFEVPKLREIDRIATNGRVNDLSWTVDGRFLLFTCDGKLFKVAGTGNELPVGTNLEFDLCACNPFRDVIALARGHFGQAADDKGGVDLKYVGGVISIRKLSDLSVISEYAAPSGITDLCWSSDGSQLYAISYDGLGIQYELKESSKQSMKLSDEELKRSTKEALKHLNHPVQKKANELWNKMKAEKQEDD